MTASPAKVAYRASLFHCLDEPQSGTDDDAVCYIDDGVLLVEDGHYGARPARPANCLRAWMMIPGLSITAAG
ncbi:MAG: hypothetical protein U5K38_06450 [Woeseiaceae bacterium]|nr:hypothetical protein [Woeseiaceae bacterium]